MSTSHVARLRIEPPLRLNVQKGALALTQGDADFRRILFSNPNYWTSNTAGEGLFLRGESDDYSEDSEQFPLRVGLDRVLLFPEGNPFDEEMQRLLSLSALWRVLPDLPAESDYAAALQIRAPRYIGPNLNPDWDEAFNQLLEEAERTLVGRGLNRFLPSFMRRSQARSKLARIWADYCDRRRKELAQVEADLGTPLSGAEWNAREERRIAHMRALLNGEDEVTRAEFEETIRRTLFPFESDIVCKLESVTDGYLSFSIPQVDRLVPQTERDVLSNGEVRKVKRDKEDLHRDFIVLAVGQAISLGAQIFSRLPRLHSLSIATQTFGTVVGGKRGRARQSGAATADTYYIFEIDLKRIDFMDRFMAPFDPMVFLSKHEARIQPIGSIALGRIEPPAWLSQT
jgi:hypothetical protein